MKLKHLIYILIPVLLLACVKEQPVDLPSEGEITADVPYSVVVYSSEPSRASIDDDSFATGRYIFQSGDRLYVEYKDGGGNIKLYGMLSLSEGQGTGTGSFDGTLHLDGSFSPEASTPISATLVGADQVIYTVTSDQITAGPNYPSTISFIAKANDTYSPDLQEYVKKYSHFTATARYDAKSFTLQQQTVFVDCAIKDIPKSALDNSAETSVLIKKGGSTIRTFTGIPLGSGRYLGDIHFIAVFSSSDDVSDGEIWFESDSDSHNHCSPDFSSSLVLQPNHYYSLNRKATEWTGFKIRAGESAATVTFNYWDDGIQYSMDNGRSWTAYTTASHPDISLYAGESVCWKGSRSNYKNIQSDQYETPSTKPIFTATQLCYISGNIMSLLYGDNYVGQTTVPDNAFSGAFSKGNNDVSFIDINSSEPLILPAMVLGEKCYKNMFRQCVNLTATPALPATTLSTDCYRGMFRKCTKLATVSIVLPAANLAVSCYQEMFRDCSKLASVPQNMLPAINLATSCYQQMFSNCIFSVAPDLPATTLANNCYDRMFTVCKNITTAPELNAETLVYQCYYQMFLSCSKLENIKCLATNISATDCTKEWVNGVKSTGTFTKALSMDSWPTGNNGIPQNWTVENYPAQ